jgi:hypothetical protein
MGTNYYHRTNICNHCNRYEEKHIGKSSAGWQFSFQGYKEDISRIMSFEDWKRELQTKGVIGVICNEYGEEISFEDFVKMVEDKQTGKFNNKPNRNRYDYCLENRNVYGYDMSREWKDKEGYSFTFAEFS